MEKRMSDEELEKLKLNISMKLTLQFPHIVDAFLFLWAEAKRARGVEDEMMSHIICLRDTINSLKTENAELDQTIKHLYRTYCPGLLIEEEDM